MKNPLIEAAQSELGTKPEIEHRGSGHLKLKWKTACGKEASIFCSATPSDWRAPKKVVADIRRKNREPYNPCGRVHGLQIFDGADAPRETQHHTGRVRQAPNPPRSRDRTLAVPLGGNRPAANGKELHFAQFPHLDQEQRQQPMGRKSAYRIDPAAMVRAELPSLREGVVALLNRKAACCENCRRLVVACACAPQYIHRRGKEMWNIFERARRWARRCNREHWAAVDDDFRAFLIGIP